MKTKMLFIFCLSILWFGSAVQAEETQQIIRARIGIEIPSKVQGDKTYWAKTYERVRVGDTLRIHVIPEPDPGYIYVVYTDRKIVEQLNEPEQVEIAKDDALILPARDELYEFDQKSKRQYITIICSLVELTEINRLLNSPGPAYPKWTKFEQTLIEKSKIDLSEQEMPKPWPIAGRIHREKGLKIFSGKFLVVTKYEFTVKK